MFRYGLRGRAALYVRNASVHVHAHTRSFRLSNLAIDTSHLNPPLAGVELNCHRTQLSVGGLWVVVGFCA